MKKKKINKQLQVQNFLKLFLILYYIKTFLQIKNQKHADQFFSTIYIKSQKS
jgi:hypothetical protein